VIDVTPTFVVASALATRDFYVVHRARDRAVAQGARDIFIDILTTTGLVQRYVSAWAPDAVVRAVSIRLGVPCYAGDTLTLSGQVTEQDGSEQVVAVTGRCGHRRPHQRPGPQRLTLRPTTSRRRPDAGVTAAPPDPMLRS
jgi:MaoC like domain